MKKYIAFDLGGVVVDNRENEVEKTSSDLIGIDIDKFRKIRDRYQHQTTLGNLSLFDYYDAILEDLGIYSTSPKGLLESHLKIHEKVLASRNEEIVDLIERLKKEYGVVSLSNIQQETMEATRESGLYELFDRNFLSSEMHLMKPNSDIYIEMLKELHAVPNEVIFIDDNNANIGTARRLSIPSIRYENFKNMKLELEALLN